MFKNLQVRKGACPRSEMQNDKWPMANSLFICQLSFFIREFNLEVQHSKSETQRPGA
jgi:hypothetical protein